MIVPSTTDRAEPDGIWAQSAKIAFRFLFIAVGLSAAGWAISNCRQVQPDSRAVVLRFGSVTRQQGAGLLIAWPRPIEAVVILPSADRQIEFPIARFDGQNGLISPGAVTVPGANPPPISVPVVLPALLGFDLANDPRQNTGFVLSGDLSVVHLQASLYYQISDPVRYLISANHVKAGLERLFIASAVAVCAARDVDTILVARPEASPNANTSLLASREQFRADLVNAVNHRLDDLTSQGAGFGITVSRVDLVPAIPRGAKAAFDRVLVATQFAEQSIAQARTQAAGKAQQTNATRDRIVTDATARAAEQLTVAKTRTAGIAALAHGSPGLSGPTLINRTYYDRVGALLKKALSVDTVDPKGGSHVIMSGPGQL